MYWPLENSLAFSDALVGYAPFGLIGEGFEAAIARYDLVFLFAYALAFIGAYLLARELGVGRPAAAVAGVAFAYAPWRLEQDGHMHVVSSGGIPLALFLLVRGYRRGSARTVFAGWLVATWQLALGFTLGLMLAYLLAVLAVVLLSGGGGSGRRARVLVASAAGMALFAAMGVLLALPYQEVRDDHPESERTADTVAAFSGGPEMFLAASEQSTIWGPITEPVRDGLDFVPEQTLFPGLLVLVLAGFGLSRASPFSKRMRIGMGVGVLALAVLSLGFQTPAHGVPYPYRALYELAPGWDAIRTPGRLNTLTSLGLALLAAAGAHAPRARIDAWSPRLRWRCRSSCCVEGMGFPNPHPTVAKPPPGLAEATPPQASPADVRVRVAPLPRVVHERLPRHRERARQLQADRVRPARAADGVVPGPTVVAYLRRARREHRRAAPGPRRRHGLGGLAELAAAGRAPAEWCSTD